MRKKCPECDHPVEPGSYACTNCPASWEHESEDGYRSKPRRDVHFLEGPVLWIMLLGACVFLAWMGIERFMALADPDNKNSALNGIVQSHSDQLDSRVAAAARGEGPDGQPGKDYTPPPQAADLASDGEHWILKGRVLDLVSLQGVPGATVVFEDPETRKKSKTSTDTGGRYSISLAPLERRGYLARVSKGGYASGYLNPGTEGVTTMPLDDRKALADDLAHANDGPYAVQPYGTDPLVTDFWLAPASPK